jgi:hypothetical protein
MNKDFYPFGRKITAEEFTYTFISEGKRGKIIKIVDFQLMTDQLFNLALGDFDAETNSSTMR